MAPALSLVLALGCSELPTAAPAVEVAATAPDVEVAPTAPDVDVAATEPAGEVADVPQAPMSAKGQTGPVTAAVAIEDAIARVLPALEASGSTQGLETALRQVLAQLEKGRGGSGDLESALTAVQNAVDSYQARAGEEFQPDISAVQLAVDVVTAGETEEGSPTNRSGS
jgi:hypothetical protein